MKELFKNYFTYWDELKAGSGYQIFGGVHIAWLAGIIVFIAVACVVFLRLGRRGQNCKNFTPRRKTSNPTELSTSREVHIRKAASEISAIHDIDVSIENSTAQNAKVLPENSTAQNAKVLPENPTTQDSKVSSEESITRDAKFPPGNLENKNSGDTFPNSSVYGSVIFSQDFILKSLAVLMLLMEVYKDAVLAATGHMELQYLPLHLCGLAIFIEAAFIFFPCTFLGELAATVCLPAALAALIFPDWLRYPTINFMNLHGFILHGLLVLIPLLIMFSGFYLPKIKNIWMPVAFLLACAVILYRVNIWLGTNFMFLNRPSNDSPFTAIYQAGGYIAYMLAFAAASLALILVMYAVSALIKKLSSR